MQELSELLKEAYRVRTHDLNKSIELAAHALTSAVEENNLPYIAEAKSMLGLFYMIRGEYQKSIELSTEAEYYFSSQKNNRGIAFTKYNIAGVHYKTNNFHLGLEYLLDCLPVFQELHDYHNESRVLKSIGTIYEYFGDHESAMESYVGSIEAAKKAGDPDAESNAYNPLSGFYIKTGDIQRAKALADKSIEIKTQTGDKRGLAFAIYARAKVNQKVKQYEQAHNDFHESLQLHRQMGDHLGESMSLNKLGLLHYETGEYTTAKKFLQEALFVAKQFNVQVIIFKAYYNLYLVAKEEGNTKDALSFLEQYHDGKNAVINTQTHNVIKSYNTIRNIQQLKHEAVLQKEKTEIIERKNAELDSFFYRVSHDLKGPISSLLGLYSIVKMDITETQALKYFEMYNGQIERINKIIMGLIDLTQMNNRSIKTVSIDFHTLIDECIDSYSYLENYKRIRFITDIGSQIEYHAEWGIINTVLQNLIENAIKYARPVNDAFVKISVVKQGSNIIIRLEDNGQGIHPDHQSKIFDMFYRANERVKGSGLGLYILKRAVERLSGEICINSTVGEGTTFTVTLPQHPVPEPAVNPV